ncbi:MAG: adenine phosphoribosyltransferase [Deltaproteobacteria bacterium]|nr:adenine phosphoribosyltransferase [Deltaproteobacteria bacterium]
MSKDTARIRSLIRDVPDFPKPGIVFKDITPVLKDAAALRQALDLLAEPFRAKRVTAVAGMESRGFIFGVPVAERLGVGFVPVRKPGKLPWRVVAEEYALEYGTDRLEMHEDALGKGDRVLIIDDLLATGGTAAATARLARRVGAEIVGAGFVVELSFLNGRSRLTGLDVHSLVVF